MVPCTYCALRGFRAPSDSGPLMALTKLIIDRATYADPSRYPEGIDVVIVNGKVVLDEGKLTAERPGRALRR